MVITTMGHRKLSQLPRKLKTVTAEMHRPAHGQDDAPQDAQLRAAVDAGGIDVIVWDRQDVLPHQKNAQGGDGLGHDQTL